MARIFVRGKTIWITYSIKGKRYRESLGMEANRENMKLARRVKALKEAEIINGIHRDIKKVRPKLLKSCFDEFMLTRAERSDPTKQLYEYAYKKLENYTGNLLVTEIDEEIVNGFERSINLSKNTVEIIFRHLRIIFEYFRSKKYIEMNPFPKKEKSPKKIKVMSEDELNLILRVLKNKNEEQYRAIKLLLMTGLRISELIRLKHEDIDYKRNIIYISNSKGKRVDAFPLYYKLREFLLTEFPTRSGKVVKYKRRDSLKFFRRELEKLGMEKYTLHEIRKTFISTLANAGMYAFDVQKLARHKDIRTTQKSYIEIDYNRLSSQLNNVIKDTIKDTTPEKSLKLVQNG